MVGIFSCLLLSHLLVVVRPLFRLQALLFTLTISCIGLQSLCSGRDTASSGLSVFTSGSTFHATRFRPQGPFFLVEFCWVCFGSAVCSLLSDVWFRLHTSGLGLLVSAFKLFAFPTPETINLTPLTLYPQLCTLIPTPINL